ncbi:response regulator [Alphaproteobacteria bacterium KMM 3653]|uniref:Response regulator n=1 Tax=Harenicola maris TaxID=2841044 RepID=A0AAP2CMI7_9RHOB|nr:response regulator [Harenicola maris]
MAIKILHVEDDPDIQDIAKIALEFQGDFVVEQASSGEEALSKADQEPPELFLMDVMMPGMSGPQLLQRFRQTPGLSDVPAIFMTARAQSEEIQALRDEGALDVIVKPFDPVSLGLQIKEILDRNAATPGIG